MKTKIANKYTLICDEVRQENTGKLLVIGLYTTNLIMVPTLPFVTPSITFLPHLEVREQGVFHLQFRIDHDDGGNPLAEGMGIIQFIKVSDVAPMVATPPLRLGPFVFPKAGKYTVTISFDNDGGKIKVPFRVVLQPQASIGTVQPPPKELGFAHGGRE